jgi:predicted Zn-dependent protease
LNAKKLQNNLRPVYELRFKRANLLRKKGDTNGAIKILSGLAVDFPDKPAAYLIIGDIFWDRGELAKAAAAFRVATNVFPKSKIASLGLFHTLRGQSKTDDAFEEMKRFQSISFCQDYQDIMEEILQKDT